MAQQKSVFISYRRTNTWTAQAVYQYLNAQGYDIFFDVDSIRTGDWLETILSQIRARAHFILILTPSAVERFKEPNDVMRLEIETAIDEQRNIIPLMFDGFDFSSVKYALTGKLEIIPDYNGMEIPARFFKYAMQQLCEDWLEVDVDAVIHPTSPQLVEKVEAIQKDSKNKPEIDETQLEAEKLYEQAILLTLDHKFPEAITTLTKAIDSQANYASAYLQRGNVKMLMNHPENAMEDYNLAIELDSENDVGYRLRGGARLLMEQLQDAHHDYNRAIELNPQDSHSIMGRGNANLLLELHQDAIDDFNRVIDIDPKHKSALFQRGNAKLFMNQYEGAIVDYTQALEIDPDDELARKNLAITKHLLK